MQRSPLYHKTDIPAGRSGDWSIEKFSIRSPVGPDDRPECFQSPAGTYTRLKKGNEVFMTDVYDEWWTQRAAIAQARVRGGDVLITGLGLGIVIASMLDAPDTRVKRVLVIEQSADVIGLVAQPLRERYAGRFEVINADAFEWLPPEGQQFSVGWHDIWPNPHETGVLAQAEQLERHYAAYCDWQGNWIRDYLATEEAERKARAG